MNLKKISIVLGLAALMLAYFTFDVGQYLSLDYLKQSQAGFATAFAQNPIQVIALFFAIYVMVTAVSLPGATILTLAAGALFGQLLGFVIASFASSVGATLSMLASRYVLRDYVQNRFGAQLAGINQGLVRDGAFYLFSLRLIPLMPFFVLNLLMGLTTIKTWTYYWVSQVGMLAATVVYVNAGTQLGQISSLRQIASAELLLSFVALGLFPLLAKKAIAIFQANKVYAPWAGQKPPSFDRNLIVIGAGAAGLVTAYIAATVKAKVTLIEAHKMGGDCLNTGCVPSKALIKTAKLATQMRHGEHYGLEASEPRFNFKKVMVRVKTVIATIAPHDSIERYTGLGVEVLQGHARIVNPWTVEITLNAGGVQRLTARSIVIAAGAQPLVPPLAGLNDVGYETSDTLWDACAQMESPPQRLVVLGGGPIGCELAQCFARLGSRVTQIEMGERILVREDEEVSEMAHSALTRDGVNVLTRCKALRCEREGQRKFIVIESQGQKQRLEFDTLLCAVGRVARLSGYGLEELGIPTQHTITTNDYLETIFPNIFVAGDAAGPYQFTHTAAHQAWYAAVNALFGDFKRFKVDYSVIPRATFIDPEVARVGLNAQEAREKGIAFEVTTYGMDDLDRAIADGTAYGFVKVLTVPGKDRILGVTIVGEHAADLLAEFVLAMKHGLGLNKILGTIHTYPTLSEANKYAAGEWKRNHAPKRVLAWLERFHTWRRH